MDSLMGVFIIGIGGAAVAATVFFSEFIPFEWIKDKFRARKAAG